MRDRQHVLLTGATGALGPALAAELLASDPTRILEVLIRAGNVPVAQRFEQWLALVELEMTARPNGSPANWKKRVHVVAGDVRCDGLGLSAASHQQLAGQVNTIIHAAADTQFLNSLDDLWETNVEGTRRVIDFAQRCRTLPKLIVVSTVCTSGTRTGLIEETSSSTPPTFVNNYERTKWESERLALSCGVPLAIARVSIVMGSDTTGAVHRMGALHHLLKWFSRGYIPVIPGTEQTLLDVICTEMVSRFIARAATADWESGSIWHVAAGERAARLSEFSKTAWAEAFPGEIMQNMQRPGHPYLVDRSTFEQIRLSMSAPGDRLTRQALDSISSFVPGLLYPRQYDTTRAEQLWGGPLPCSDWRESIIRVMRSYRFAPRRQRVA
ncbi:MAG TPA: SDR family oxidoreductase [Tepidisphaeraceae bacterium]|jgi:nucleoside-diphosphate-sugar epimerase